MNARFLFPVFVLLAAPAAFAKSYQCAVQFESRLIVTVEDMDAKMSHITITEGSNVLSDEPSTQSIFISVDSGREYQTHMDSNGKFLVDSQLRIGPDGQAFFHSASIGISGPCDPF